MRQRRNVSLTGSARMCGESRILQRGRCWPCPSCVCLTDVASGFVASSTCVCELLCVEYELYRIVYVLHCDWMRLALICRIKLHHDVQLCSVH